MSLLEASFRVVLDVSWRASWLILAALALRALLRGRLPARVVFWAWIAVAVRLLCPLALPAAWSPFNAAPFAPHASDSTAARGVQPTAADWPASTDSIASVAPVADEMSPSVTLSSVPWLALIWLAGAVALGLARLGAYARFARKLRGSRTAPDAATARLVAEAANAQHLERITVSETSAVAAPALHGIVRPELLLPRGFVAQLSPGELAHTIAHELAHARRRDLLAQLLIHGAALLHWFNPLAWIAARLARADCELACDETVLRRLNPAGRESYGATLLKIIRLAHCGTPPPLGLGVVESKQQIKRRIQMIAAHPSTSLARTVAGCALFALAAGLSLTSETRAQITPVASAAPAAAATPAPVAALDAPPPAALSGPLAKATMPAAATPKSPSLQRSGPGLPESEWPFTYEPATDRLDTLFPNGVVATLGERSISVADVRREVKPAVPLLQRDARDQVDFNQRLNRLQNDVIRTLVGRILLIKEFHAPVSGEMPRHIPASYVDNEIDDRIKAQFDGDRAKLLADLAARGMTMDDFRREIEEEIIYHYMQGQERKLKGGPAPEKSKSIEGVKKQKEESRIVTPKAKTLSGSSSPAPESSPGRTVTLIALDTVRVEVNPKLADESPGENIFVGTLASGQRQIVSWGSPIYISASDGKNLQIEYNGKRYPAGFTGAGRCQMN
jgi:beta-lactamase regulating signal transducer with metallopeptidase domain